MKTFFLYFAIGCSAIFCLSACSGDMSTANTERARSPTNSTGSVMNSAGNAMNSVSNAVSGMTTTSAENFMKDAAQGGMAEVEMGKMAAQKSQNPEIKKFGQMMAADHAAAGKELEALAAKKNITLPKDVGSHKSAMDSLAKESAADFDKAYVNAMVSDHEADVSAFQKQADNAADSDVKAFAAKTLPTLKKHLETIKAIEAKMK